MSYLKGFSNIGDSTITNTIRDNLKLYLDYGLLEKFNFINVSIPSTGTYGGLDHRLRLSKDPRYTNGQVWQSFRNNWVWESGFGAFVGSDNSRPGVSGVYVNDVFYPNSTTGTYSHYIDHINGRVIFNTAISTNSRVECNYSYKYINVVKADGLQWFKELQSNSERSDDSNFIRQSGEWSQLPENRYQTPLIGIELLPNRSMQGYQLGGGQYVRTDFIFHCVSEDPYFRDFLVDAISLQNEKTLVMFDLNAVSSGNAFPLDYRGVPVSGALRYPSLVENYPTDHLRIYNMRFDSVYEIGNLFIGSVKCTTETVLGV